MTMRVAFSRCRTILAISAIALLGAGGITTVAAVGSGELLLRIFAVVVLASFPGWLFVRFIGIRAESLWTEYVLHLHRLGIDGHGNLPEPAEASGYHGLWKDEGGERTTALTIYQQKFEAYYGVAVSPENQAHAPLPLKTLPPVLLATAVLAVGWTAVLFHATPLTIAHGQQLSAEDALRFGFIGSYVFIVQMLIRRFFQSDLKPSAYFAAVARIATVLIVVLAVHHAVAPAFTTPAVEVATAFLIGFFPLLGMQIIHGVASVAFRKFVPTLTTPYPLSDLDGMNIWYEARLMEEGIEDLENLVTGNLVDILLRTRVPVGRLVDWIDQAALLLVLDPADPDGDGPLRDDRSTLRRLGVRTATDLETMFLPADRLERRAAGAIRPHGDDEPFQLAMAGVLDRSGAKGPSVVPSLLRSFSNLPNLVHVRHWRDVLCSDHHESPPALDEPEAQPALPAATVPVDDLVLPAAAESVVVLA